MRGIVRELFLRLSGLARNKISGISGNYFTMTFSVWVSLPLKPILTR
jgi:hypothetical protein